MHTCAILLTRFISFAAKRVSWLRRENGTRFSRKRFEFSPSTKTRSKLSLAKRPLENAALTIRSSRALSARAIHGFLSVPFDNNEFRIFVSPLLLFLFREHTIVRKIPARDATTRKCCHRLSRQNAIDEIEMSVSFRKMHFFRKDYVSLNAPVTLPGRCTMSIQKTWGRFTVFSAKKFQGAGWY